MFEFWMFTELGIHHSPTYTLRDLRIFREFAPQIEREYLIYVA